MTDPEDRVLIGVINRKRDLECLRRERWYRIPMVQMPDGIDAEVLGIYVSRNVRGGGAIRYYGVISGIELAYRRWLLPHEAHHPRADGVYYRVALAEVLELTPPITNPTRRRIYFIRTVWGRFRSAAVLQDLYH
jgi:hypothetical protein